MTLLMASHITWLIYSAAETGTYIKCWRTFIYCHFGRRSFPVAAAVVWNTLPVRVQSSHLSQPFANGWRHSCFNSHSQTSSSDIANYVMLDFEMAIAVLATLKISWLIDWLLTGKPEEQQFTMWSGILIGISSRQCTTVSGHPLPKRSLDP